MSPHGINASQNIHGGRRNNIDLSTDMRRSVLFLTAPSANAMLTCSCTLPAEQSQNFFGKCHCVLAQQTKDCSRGASAATGGNGYTTLSQSGLSTKEKVLRCSIKCKIYVIIATRTSQEPFTSSEMGETFLIGLKSAYLSL